MNACNARPRTSRIQPLVTVALLLAAAAVVVPVHGAEGDAGRPVIGYRHDGTGVFPADCRPVTSWNETDLKRVPAKDRHGRPTTRLAADKPNPRNIVWKTPLNTYCVGGMIVVGGKLYQLMDRGGIGYATELVPDFVGPVLVCMDPADGTILWKKELHHLDKLEGVDPQKAREAILGYCRQYVEAYSIHRRFYDLGKKINSNRELTPAQQEHYATLAKQYARFIPDLPVTADAAKGHPAIKMMKGYVQTSFWGIMKKYLPDMPATSKQAQEWGYCWNAWFGNSSFVGSAMPTPISDGTSIWVATGYNDAYRIDAATGEITWCNWYGPQAASWGAYITSPVLHAGVLITHHGTGQHKDLWYRGVDAETGRELWVTRYPTASSYHMVTPAPMSLPIAGTDETVDVIWTGAGNVIRVSDGKIIGTDLGVHANARPFAYQDDVVVIRNGSSEGGSGKAKGFKPGLMALRLVARSADEVVGEQLWHAGDPKKEDDARLVAHDGKVYGFCQRGGGGWAMRIRDLETGAVIGTTGMPSPAFIPQQMSSLVGNLLFALHGDGMCAVYDVADPTAPKALGVNQLGTKAYHKEYGAFNQGGAPFFSGNRIFIRSYTDVYCIGDPDKELVLSEAHR